MLNLEKDTYTNSPNILSINYVDQEELFQYTLMLKLYAFLINVLQFRFKLICAEDNTAYPSTF